jgi:two-component system sensor histidine kinase EvgS
MPGMNGFELMKEMREDERLSPFKSVALTGFDADSDHDMARAAGFDDCLVKPIDMDFLFSTIERLAMSLSEETL